MASANVIEYPAIIYRNMEEDYRKNQAQFLVFFSLQGVEQTRTTLWFPGKCIVGDNSLYQPYDYAWI